MDRKLAMAALAILALVTYVATVTRHGFVAAWTGGLTLALIFAVGARLIYSLASRMRKIDGHLGEILNRQRRTTAVVANIAGTTGRLAPRVRFIEETVRKPQAGSSAAGMAVAPGSVSEAGPTFDPWDFSDRKSSRPGLRVGVILDDFSRLAFAFEWEQVVLEPSSWRKVLAEEPIELLFVESAWNGNERAWQYHLTGISAPRPDFIELVAYCRDLGIPTVFWNKEDPVHFEEFLESAALFDYVYTTDVNRVDDYVARLGHDRVGVLPFAAQPAIHNPIRSHGRGPQRDVAFGGMYFAHKYPERREQMDLLLGGAYDVSSRMEHGLEIFSRFQGGDERYQFPEPFASRVVGSLDYDRMLTAYREYKVFLNVNSIVDSPSMCARRVFEIAACGTPVVTTPSSAIGEFFPPDEVFVVGDRAEAGNTVRALVRSPELRDRVTHLAQRRIWREHTYGARVQGVLHDVGLVASPVVPRSSVTAMVSTNRPHQMDHILESVGGQRGAAVQLALLTHGFEVNEADLRIRAKDAGIQDVVLLTAGTDVSLGSCLNRLVAASDGDVVAKMDDDDMYGTQYLSDQLNAMEYSGAGLVGKQAHYMYIGGMDATLLRFPEREHRFTDFVMGPTIVVRRELALATPFHDLARGEDSAFLRDIGAAGGRIYSADRFNFVQMRTSSGAHTWTVSDAELLASGAVEFYGRPDTHPMI